MSFVVNYSRNGVFYPQWLLFWYIGVNGKSLFAYNAQQSIKKEGKNILKFYNNKIFYESVFP